MNEDAHKRYRLDIDLRENWHYIWDKTRGKVSNPLLWKWESRMRSMVFSMNNFDSLIQEGINRKCKTK